jgi:hypothetical protein
MKDVAMPEIVRSFLRLSYILAAVFGLTFSRAGAASPLDPLATFCKTHPNVDFPTRTVVGRKLTEGGRRTLTAVQATNWRCMNGRVYACSRGASGSGCLKMNPSREASDEIRETCKGNPGQTFIAIAVIGNSSSTWRCDGQTPVIIKTVPLDQRGFMKQTWFPLFDSRGKLNANTEPEVDPR